MKHSSRFNTLLLSLLLVVVGLILGLTDSVAAQAGGNVEQIDVSLEATPGLSTLVDQADLIIIGQASNVASNFTVNEFGDELIVSEVNIQLEEVLKGEAELDQELVLEGLWSGQVGEIAMASSDAPLFIQGERFVLFLEAEAGGDFGVVDGDLGKFNIDAANRLPKIGRTVDEFRRTLAAVLSGDPLPAISEDNGPEQNAIADIADGDSILAPTGPDWDLLGQRWAGASPVVGYSLNNPGFNDANAGTVLQQNSAITLAADTWTVTGGARFGYRYNGVTATNTSSNNGVNVVMVRNAANGITLATAFSWWNTTTNLYLDCDIVFWDANYAFSATSAAGTYDIRSIVLHEFGHCLGLDHSLVPQASLFATFAVGEQRRQLHPDDLTGSRLIYGAGSASRWVAAYGHDAGGWRVNEHPRLLADVNGDGQDDVVGFASQGIFVSLSTGGRFTTPSLWIPAFGSADGWQVAKHLRLMADVNGDDMADVVGFADDGVYVATSAGMGFDDPTRWVAAYGYTAGFWRIEYHPRFLADVNGDGMDDVVGFASAGVYVSISTGTGFNAPVLWVSAFGHGDGWLVENHPRLMAYVNDDDMADVVGFANDGVYVSTSTGSGFNAPTRWIAAFGYNLNVGGWRVERHPRFMADVNGDGLDDVVGFGGGGVWVSTSTGSGFNPQSRWVSAFGYGSAAGSWRTEYHPRFLADVNGDGRDDVVGFGDPGVAVSTSTGTAFTAPGVLWVDTYGYRSGGWQIAFHPRMMADVDGDGRADVVGFGNGGVYVSRSAFPNVFE